MEGEREGSEEEDMELWRIRREEGEEGGAGREGMVGGEEEEEGKQRTSRSDGQVYNTITDEINDESR